MARRSWNKKDATSYRPIIDWVVRDLALMDVKVAYWFKAYTSIGGRATELRDGSGYIVKVSTNESDSRIRFTIAHELRHIWQYTHKHLTYTWNGVEWDRIWDGVTYSSVQTNLYFRKNAASYKLLPWEKDANDYADRVMKHLQSIPTRS